MDAQPVRCDPQAVNETRPLLPDEVYGARAAGALLVGDLASAEAQLSRVRLRYLVAFCCRLSVIAPSVAVRLAWRVASRRCRRSTTGVRSR